MYLVNILLISLDTMDDFGITLIMMCHGLAYMITFSLSPCYMHKLLLSKLNDE